MISTTISIYTWRQRRLTGAIPFFFLFLFLTLWSSTLLFQLVTNSFELKLFWEKVKSTSTIFIPVCWVLFTYQYANPSKRISRTILIGLFIQPLIHIFVVWVFQLDELLWHSIILDETQTLLLQEFGPWFQTFLIYANILIGMGAIFLGKIIIRAPRLYSRQAISLILALLFPWITNTLYILKIFPIFNPAPITFSISGIILYWGFFEAGLLDIVPIARASVIENMHVGVIVLDLKNRIVDINPGAQMIIGKSQQALIGMPLNSVFEPGYALLLQWLDTPFQQISMPIRDGTDENYFDCQLTNILDGRGRVNGRLFTLNNVTKRNQSETALRHYTQRLQFLYATNQAILNAQEPEQMATVTLKYIRRFIPFKLATVVLFSYETDESILLALNPNEGGMTELIRKRPLNAFVGIPELQSGQIVRQDLIVNPVTTQPLQQYKEQGIKLIYKLPLLVRKELIGSLNIFADTTETFSNEHITILQEVSIALAVALQQANLLEQERSQRKLAQTFHEVGQALTSSLDLQNVLELILVELAKVVFYDSASIMLLEGNILNSVIHRSIHQSKKRVKSFDINEFEHLKEVIQTKSPLIIPNTDHDPRWKSLPTTSSTYSWLGVPLKQQGKIIGLLNITKAQENFYHQRDCRTALMFATQAVAAIENAQLFESERQTRKQEEVLRAANIALTKSLDLDKILNKILEYLSQLIHYDSASVMLIEKDKQVAVYAMRGYEQWTDAEQTKKHRFKLVDTPNLDWLYKHKQALIVPDTYQFEGWKHLPHARHIHNWMGVPLIAGGELFGFFSLDKTQTHFFTDTHLHAAKALAAQAAIAIQNAKLFQETQQKTAELEALSNLTTALRLANDVDQMLTIILKKATAVIPNSLGTIYLIDLDKQTLILRAASPHSQINLTERIPIGHGVIGQAAENGELFISDHATTPTLPFSDQYSECKNITLPLRTQDLTVGVINISIRHDHHFVDSERKHLIAISEIGGSAIHRTIVLDTLEQRVAKRTYELAEANEQLLELDRLKSKFVADVSHELRTPVTNLRLYLDLFARVSPEKQVHYLEILKKQSSRLSDLIEDILTLSKLETDLHTLKFEDVQLNEIVEQVVEAHLSRITASENIVQFELHPQLPLIRASRIQLFQIVTNLLANATNFSNQGEVQLKTMWHPETQLVSLRVQDNGHGIHPNDLPHIFDRFYRGQQSSQSTIPGTGLGLAIVKEIVESYQGTIEVESKLTQGTTFRIQFPTQLQ
ncbi:MAG: GAF domain-containing protein [Chloroflexi bacterium]|nr:GAF domain-containing protein [Chloroflexota bacterium]